MKQKMYTLASDNGDGSFSVEVFKTEKERYDYVKEYHDIDLDDEDSEDDMCIHENGELGDVTLEIVDGKVQSFSVGGG